MRVETSAAEQLSELGTLLDELGGVLRAVDPGALKVEEKGKDGPVTEFDRYVERRLSEWLKRCFPGITIIGEEYGISSGDPSSGLRAYVDPIDGTFSFTNGVPTYAILLSVFDGESPLLAVIDLPGLRLRLAGTAGFGVSLNGNVFAQPHFNSELMSVGDDLFFEMNGLAELRRRLPELGLRVRSFTDAFGHYLALTGGVRVMVDPGLRPWDYRASLALAGFLGLGFQKLRPRVDDKGVEVVDVVLGRPDTVRQAAAMLLCSPR